MAQVEGINLPDELYYQPDDHLWVRMEGTRASVGLDDLAQR
jgi:glycine cleavage system H lipoate-binding protein